MRTTSRALLAVLVLKLPGLPGASTA